MPTAEKGLTVVDQLGGEDDVEQVGEELMIVNEFTAVRVRKVRTRNGERLEIASALGYKLRLDALGLEALSWQTPSSISALLETPFGPESGTDRL